MAALMRIHRAVGCACGAVERYCAAWLADHRSSPPAAYEAERLEELRRQLEAGS